MKLLACIFVGGVAFIGLMLFGQYLMPLAIVGGIGAAILACFKK